MDCYSLLSCNNQVFMNRLARLGVSRTEVC